jgi:hypothetical protein
MQAFNTVKTLTSQFHPAQEDPALLADMAAIWGAFLHEGLMDSLSAKRDRQILGHWKMGCIELMTETCKYLPDVWKEAYIQWDNRETYCGIFEYEVIALLGHYLGDYLLLNNGNLPPKAEVVAMIQTLVYCFLENSVQTQKTG